MDQKSLETGWRPGKEEQGKELQEKRLRRRRQGSRSETKNCFFFFFFFLSQWSAEFQRKKSAKSNTKDCQ